MVMARPTAQSDSLGHLWKSCHSVVLAPISPGIESVSFAVLGARSFSLVFPIDIAVCGGGVGQFSLANARIGVDWLVGEEHGRVTSILTQEKEDSSRERVSRTQKLVINTKLLPNARIHF